MSNSLVDVTDTMRFVQGEYHTILRVNLTDGTYTEIVSDMENPSDDLWERINEFADRGFVLSEDVEGYQAFTDREVIRKHFRESDRKLEYRYRRKVGDKFRWVCLMFYKSEQYTEEKEEVLLIVKDMEKAFRDMLERNRILESTLYYDRMTGLHNEERYDVVCEEYQGGPVGVIYADLNGLRYMNETFGREMGDRYIKNFASLLLGNFRLQECYHLGGDEFLVVILGIPEAVFKKRFEKLKEEILRSNRAVAAVGYGWDDSANSIEKVTKVAEKMMYENKSAIRSKAVKDVRLD